MARMKFLCDAERCIECNACVTACKNENEVPWGVNRRRVVTINDGKPGERSISVACVHCSDAPCMAVAVKGDPGLETRAVQPFGIVEALSPPGCRVAAPGPVAEVFLERAGAEIGVEIAVAGPGPAGAVDLDLDIGDGREGAPDMGSVRRQRQVHAGHGAGCHADLPAHPADQGRRGDLVDVDDQPSRVPAHHRRADLQPRCRLAQRAAAAVSHGEPPARTIGRHVDADMVLRAFPPRPPIPRRKDRPDEADHRHGAGSVVAYPVDIPPGIAVRPDIDGEVRSFKIASAACRAESVAIGTPAPGCAPPPAR